MSARLELRSESARIKFLLERDGPEATQAWVERTIKIYRQALRSGSTTSDSLYRPRFEQAIREFEEWLATQRPPEVGEHTTQRAVARAIDSQALPERHS